MSAAKIESTTRASYYPHAGPITVKALAEKGSGRLLGAQIRGDRGGGQADRHLRHGPACGMSVQEMINLDLSYAPPYSNAWGHRPHRRPPGG